MRLTFFIITALLATSIACSYETNLKQDPKPDPTSTRLKQRFPETNKIYKSDLLKYDASYYVDLDGLTSVTLDDKCQGVAYTGPNEPKLKPSITYPEGVKGCSSVEIASDRDMFFLLCDAGKTLILSQTINDKVEQSPKTDLTAAVLEGFDISSCSKMVESRITSTLYLYCSISKKVEPTPPTPQALTQGSTAAILAYKLEDSEGKKVFSFQAATKIVTIGLSDNFLMHVLDKEGTDHIYLIKYVTSAFDGFRLTYTGEKFEDITKVTSENIPGFPKGTIADISSDSEHLLITTKDETAKQYGIYLCSLDNAQVTSRISCNGDEPVYSFDEPAITEGQMIKVMAKKAVNYKDIDLVVAQNNQVAYNKLKKDTTTSKYNPSEKSLSIVEFRVNTNFALGPQDFDFFSNRLILRGFDKDGRGLVSIIYLSSSVKMDVPLGITAPGFVFANLDSVKSNDDAIFYFEESKGSLFVIENPTITATSVAQADTKIDPATFSCGITFKFAGDELLQMSLSYIVFYDPKKVIRVEVSPNTAGYTNSKFTVPVFSDQFDGNNPDFGVIGPTGVRPSILYINDVDVKDSIKPSSLTEGETTPFTGNLEYIGDHQYMVRSVDDVLLIKCVREDTQESIQCTENSKITKSAFSQDSFTIRESMVVGANVFFVVDTRNEKGDGAAMSKVIVYNLSTKKINTYPLTEAVIDAATMQVHKGQLYIYVVRNSNTVATINYISVKLQAEYAATDIKLLETVPLNLPICAVAMEVFPHNMKQFGIYSKCDKENTKKIFYQLKYSLNKPENVKLVSTVDVNEFSSPEFCLTDGHIHAWETDKKDTFKYASYDADADDGSTYSYPIQDFVKFDTVLDAACGFAKDSVHLLVSSGSEANKIVTLINLNGEAQGNPNKRIHSIKILDSQVSDIAAGSSHSTGEDIILYATNLDYSQFGAIVLQPDGPRILLDALDYLTTGEAIFAFAASKGDGIVGGDFVVDFKEFVANPTLSLISNTNRLPIDTGKAEKSSFNLDEYLTLNGPIFDIQYSDSASNAKFTGMRVSPSEDTVLRNDGAKFIGIKNVDDSTVVAWTADSINIYENKKVMIPEDTKGKVLDVDVVSFIFKDKAYNVVFIIIEGNNGQELFVIYKGKDDVWAVSESKGLNSYLENATYFYDDSIASAGDYPDLNFLMVASDNYLVPQLSYNSISIIDEEVQITQKDESHIFEARIYSFSAVKVKNAVITTSLVGNERGVRFALATQAQMAGEIRFTAVTTQLVVLIDSQNSKDKHHLEHEDSTISCLAKTSATTSVDSVECFISTIGVYSYATTFTLNKLDDIINQTTPTPIVDETKSFVTKTMLNIKGFNPMRVTLEGSYAAVLLKKQTNRDALMNSANSLQQKALLVVYNLKNANRHAHAVVQGFDFADESIENVVFEFYLKTASSSGLMQGIFPTLAVPTQDGKIKNWTIKPSFMFEIADQSKINENEVFTCVGLTEDTKYRIGSFMNHKYTGERWFSKFPQDVQLLDGDYAVFDFNNYLNMDGLGDVAAVGCDNNVAFTAETQTSIEPIKYPEGVNNCNVVEHIESPVGAKYITLCNGGTILRYVYFSRLNPYFDPKFDLTTADIGEQYSVIKCSAIKQAGRGEIYAYCDVKEKKTSAGLTQQPSFVKTNVLLYLWLEGTGVGNQVLALQTFKIINQKIHEEISDTPTMRIIGSSGTDDETTNIYILNSRDTMTGYKIESDAGNTDNVFTADVVRITSSAITNFPQDPINDISSDISHVVVTTRKEDTYSIYLCFKDLNADSKLGCSKEPLKSFDVFEGGILNVMAEKAMNSRDLNIVVASNNAFIYYSFFQDKTDKNKFTESKIKNDIFQYASPTNFRDAPTSFFKIDERIVLTGESEQGIPMAVLVFWKTSSKIDLQLPNAEKGVLVTGGDADASGDEDIYLFTSTGVYNYDVTNPKMIISANKDDPNDPQIVKCTIKAVFPEAKDGVDQTFSATIYKDSKKQAKIEVAPHNTGYSSFQSFIPVFTEDFYGNNPEISVLRASRISAKALYAEEVEVNYQMKQGLTQGTVPASQDKQMEYIGNHFYIARSTNQIDIIKCERRSLSDKIDCTMYDKIMNSDLTANTFEIRESLFVEDRILLAISTTTKVDDQEPRSVAVFAVYNLITKANPAIKTIETNMKAAGIQAHYSNVYFYYVNEYASYASITAAKMSFSDLDDITNKFLELDTNDLDIEICPRDLKMFPHNMKQFLIYSVCGEGESDYKKLYQVSFNLSSPEKISLVSTINIVDFTAPDFCPTDGHIHVVETDPSMIFNYQSYDADADDTSTYKYPITDFFAKDAEVKGIDLACGFQKNAVHVLVSVKTTGDEGKTVNKIVNLNGQAQNKPNKRIHSIIDVPVEVSKIAAGASHHTGEEIILYATADDYSAFSAVVIQPDGPRIIVDASYETATGPQQLFIRILNRTKDVPFTVDLTNFSDKPEIKVTKKVNIEARLYELKTENVQVTGPLYTMEYRNKDQAAKDAIKFINKLSPSDSFDNLEDLKDKALLGVRTVDGKLILAWTKDSFNLYDNGKKVLADDISGKVLDASVTLKDEGVMVFVIADSGNSGQLLTVISKNSKGTYISGSTSYVDEFQESTRFFTGIDNTSPNAFAVVSMNNFLAPQITYTRFDLEEKENKFVINYDQTPERVYYKERVYSFDATVSGENIVTLALVGNEKGIHISLAKIVTEAMDLVLTEIRNEVFYLLDSTNNKITYHIEHEESKMDCNLTNDSFTQKNSINCFIATSGTSHFFVQVSLNDLKTIADDDSKPLVNSDSSYIEKFSEAFPGFTPTRVSLTGSIAVVSYSNSKPSKKTALEQSPRAPASEQRNLVVLYNKDTTSISAEAFLTGDEIGMPNDEDSEDIYPVFFQDSRAEKAVPVLVVNSKTGIKSWKLQNPQMQVVRPDIVDWEADKFIIRGFGGDLEQPISLFFIKKFSGKRWIKDLPEKVNMLNGDKIIYDLSNFLNMDGITDFKPDPSTKCEGVDIKGFTESTNIVTSTFPENMVDCKQPESTYAGDMYYLLCKKGSELRLAQFNMDGDRKANFDSLIDLTTIKVEELFIDTCSKMKEAKDENNLYLYCSTNYRQDSAATEIVITQINALIRLEYTYDGEKSIFKAEYKNGILIKQKKGEEFPDEVYLHILKQKGSIGKVIVSKSADSLYGMIYSLTNAGEFEIPTPFVVTDIDNFPKGKISSISSDFEHIFITTKENENYSVYVCIADDSVKSGIKCGESAIYLFDNLYAGKVNVMAKKAGNYRDIDLIAVSNEFLSYMPLTRGADSFSFDAVAQKISRFDYAEATPYNDYPTDFFVIDDRIVLLGQTLEKKPHVVLAFWKASSKVKIYLPDVGTGSMLAAYDYDAATYENLFFFGTSEVQVFEISNPRIIITAPKDSTDNTIDVNCKLTPEFLSVSNPLDERVVSAKIYLSPNTEYRLSVSPWTAGYRGTKFTVPVFTDDFYGNNPDFSILGGDKITGRALYADPFEVIAVVKDKKSSLTQTEQPEWVQKNLEYVGSQFYIARSTDMIVVVRCERSDTSVKITCTEYNSIKNSVISSAKFGIKESRMIGTNLFLVCDTPEEGDGKPKSKIVIYNTLKGEATVAPIGNGNLAIAAAGIQVHKEMVYIFAVINGVSYASISVAKFPVGRVYTPTEMKFEETSIIDRIMCPIDIELFPHNLNQMIIYSKCSSNGKVTKTLFQIEYSLSKPTEVNLISTINIGDFKAPEFCVTDGHIHVFETDGELKYVSYDSDADDTSSYNYALDKFITNGKLIDASCGFQKNTVHLLVSEGDKNKLININGIAQNRPNQRIHSIVQMEDTGITAIAAGSSHITGEDIIMYATADDYSAFGSVVIQPDGPRILIDATAVEGIGENTLTVNMNGNKVQDFSVELFNSELFPSVKLTKPKEYIPIDRELSTKLLIPLGNYLKFEGPLVDIRYDSPTKTGSIVSRISNPSAETNLGAEEKFIGVETVDGSLYAAWTIDSICVYDKKATKLIEPIKGKILDVDILKTNYKEKIIFTIFIIVETEAGQQLYALYTDADGKWIVAQTGDISMYLENATYFATQQSESTSSVPELRFYIVAADNFLAPQIVYNTVSIDRASNKMVLEQKENQRFLFTERIYSFSAVISKGVVLTAALIGNQRGIQFTAAKETFDKKRATFDLNPVSQEIFTLINTANTVQKYHLEHEDSSINCQVILASMATSTQMKCFISTVGMQSFYITVEFNNLEKVEDAGFTLINESKSEVNNVLYNIIGFDPILVRMRGNYAAVLLKKKEKDSSALKQPSGTSILDKKAIIAVYQLESFTKYPVAFITNFDYDGEDINSLYFELYQDQDVATMIAVPYSNGQLKNWAIRQSYTLEIPNQSNVDRYADKLVFVGLSKEVSQNIGEFMKRSFSDDRWKAKFPPNPKMLEGDQLSYELDKFLNLDGLTGFNLGNGCDGVSFTGFTNTDTNFKVPYEAGMSDCIIEPTYSGDNFYMLCNGGTKLRIAQFTRVKGDYSQVVDLTQKTFGDYKVTKCTAMKETKSNDNLYVYCQTTKNAAPAPGLQQQQKLTVNAVLRFKLERDTQKQTYIFGDYKGHIIGEEKGHELPEKVVLHLLETDSGKNHLFITSGPNKLDGYKVTYGTDESPDISEFTITAVSNAPRDKITGIVSDFRHIFITSQSNTQVFLTLCLYDGSTEKNLLTCSKDALYTTELNSAYKFSVMAKIAANLKDIDVVVTSNVFTTYLKYRLKNKDDPFGFEAVNIGNVDDDKSKSPQLQSEFPYSIPSLYNDYPTDFMIFDNRMILTGNDENGKPVATLIFLYSGNKVDVAISDTEVGTLFTRLDTGASAEEDIYLFTDKQVIIYDVSSPKLIVNPTPKKDKDPAQFSCEVSPIFNKKTGEKRVIAGTIYYDAKAVTAISLVEKITGYTESRFAIPVFSTDFEGNNPKMSIGAIDGLSTTILYQNEVNVKAFDSTSTALTQQPGSSYKGLEYIGHHHYIASSNTEILLIECLRQDITTEIKCTRKQTIKISDISNKAVKIIESRMVGSNVLIICDTSAEAEENKNYSEFPTAKLYIYNIKNQKSVIIKLSDFEDSTVKAATIQNYLSYLYFFIVTENKVRTKISFVKIPEVNTYSDIMFKGKFQETSIIDRKICPMDIEAFPHSTNQLVIYSKCEVSDGGDKKSIFQIKYDLQKPEIVDLIATLDLDTFNQPKYCVTDGHIHVFEGLQKGIFKYISYDSDEEDSSTYVYPLTSFTQFDTVLDVSCGFQKNSIHILVGMEADKTKSTLINLNGMAQNNPNKRVHSIVELKGSETMRIDDIAAGSSHHTGEDIILYASKIDYTAFGAIVLQPDGPRIIVDASKSSVPKKFNLELTFGAIKKSIEVGLEKFKANPQPSLLNGEKPIPLTNYKEPIKIREYIDFAGPTMSVAYQGAAKVTISPRVQEDKPILIDDKNKQQFIGTRTIDGDLVLAWSKQEINIYLGNKAQLSDHTITGDILDVDLVTFDYAGKRYKVAFVIIEETDGQVVHAIYMDKNNKWAVSSAYTLDDFVENATFFYDTPKDAPLNPGDFPPLSFVMVAIDNYLAPQILYQSLSIDTSSGISKISFDGTPDRRVFMERVYSFDALKIGDYFITASLVGNYKGVHFGVASKVSAAGTLNVVELDEQIFPLVENKDGDNKKTYHLEHEDSSIHCFSKDGASDKQSKVWCFISALGMYSYSSLFTINPLEKVVSDIDNKLKIVDEDNSYVANVMYNIKGFDPIRVRADNYFAAVLLKKSASSDSAALMEGHRPSFMVRESRLLQKQQGSMLGNDYLLAIFSLENESRYADSIIANFAPKDTNIDNYYFDLYTKTTKPAGLTQTAEQMTLMTPGADGTITNRGLSHDFVMTIEDASKIDLDKDNFVFGGLSESVKVLASSIGKNQGPKPPGPVGPSDSSSTPPNVPTGPTEPKSLAFWIYLAVAVVIILIVVAGVAAYFFMAKSDEEDEEEEEADDQKTHDVQSEDQSVSEFSKL